MHRTPRHLAGFTLIELMSAVAIAIVTGLVVLQTLAVYQTRKATTTGHNDAEINASIGLYAVEQDIRSAGAGLMGPTGLMCAPGINIEYNNAVYSNGGPFRAVQITDGGNGPDTISVIHSDALQAAAPLAVIATMANPSDVITTQSSGNLAAGQLVVVGNMSGSKVCTLMQITQAPTIAGTTWTLTHASATSLYNPTSPATTFTTPVSYAAQDSVVGLGTTAIWSIGLVCNDGGTPTSTNNCDLARYDRLVQGSTPTLANVQSLAPQIIEFQAQYGIAAAGTQNVTQWVDATGAWSAPTQAAQNQIKAIRIGLIARGNREGTVVSPANLVLWDAGLPTQRVRALSADEQHYRYQVLTVIVPLINIIWAQL